MTMRRVAAVAVVLALAGTALVMWRAIHQGHSNQAASLCAHALHRSVGSQAITTVGAVRRLSVGGPPPLNSGDGSITGEYPAHGAFGTSADSAPAAWCWVRQGSWWAAYGVGPDGSAVLFSKVSDTGGVPAGQPIFK
jgi:hypothetical protein